MRIYKYVVSGHRDDWIEGYAFDSLDEARKYVEASREYSKRAACITKLAFKLDTRASVLVDDNRVDEIKNKGLYGDDGDGSE